MKTPRARRMADRIARAIGDLGVSPEGVARVVGAYGRAMTVRESGPAALPSEKHPAFLHPGRTVLILAADLEEAEVPVLALGALVESRDHALRVGEEVVEEVLGGDYPEVFEWWRTIPRPEWDPAVADPEASCGELLEAIVTAPEPVQRVVLSEALDHLRHAHLWESTKARTRAVELATTVLAPAAGRTHPVLDRRYSWWVKRVAPGLAPG